MNRHPWLIIAFFEISEKEQSSALYYLYNKCSHSLKNSKPPLATPGKDGGLFCIYGAHTAIILSFTLTPNTHTKLKTPLHAILEERRWH